MKRLMLGAALAVPLLFTTSALAEDPFAAGADALAVKGGDGSSSVRAKLKLKKMKADMVMVRVKGVDDRKFPRCVVTARVLKAAKSKARHFKLIARSKTYRFTPVLKLRRGQPNLRHKMTQNNLGACYYPKKTKLVIRVTGVNLKKKVFKAAEIYLK